MLSAALFLILGVLAGAGFLAVLLALGAAPLSDDVDYGTDDLPADDIRRANPAVDRWVSRDGIAAELDADRADLPYGGGWGA